MAENRRGVTEGLLIAAVPAVGYWFAFLYELGYCKYFDIPSSFIEVGILNILVAIVSLFFMLALINIYASPVFMIFRKIPTELKPAFIGTCLAFVIVVGGALISKLTLFVSAILFSIIIVPTLFIELILPLFTQRKTQGYLAKINAQNKSDLEHDSLIDVMAVIIGKDKLLFLIIVLALSCLVFFSGGYNAKRQKDFIVLTGPTETVVLKTFKEAFIAAKFDRASKSVSSEYVIVPSGKQIQNIKYERVGPLQPKGLK